LIGPLAKIERAEDQLDALSAEIGRLMEQELYSVVAEANTVEESYSIYLEERVEIPTLEWGLRIGEVVHNARGALDHLVAQLVLVSGGTIHTRHQFPIVKAEDEWERLVVEPSKDGKRGMLDFVSPAHIAAIKAFQPHVPTTGKPNLAALQRFSNADKHRLIHAAATWVTAAPEIAIEMVYPLDMKEITHHSPGSPIGKRTEIARAFPSLWLDFNAANKKVNVDAKVKLTTVFGEPGDEDTRVRSFRDSLADVRGVVESFRPAFP
jgi:hypothetical protein